MRMQAFIILCAILLGCQWSPNNSKLPGRYALLHYESVKNDKYYIMSNSDGAVIPPVVRTIAVQGSVIYGYCEPIGVRAFGSLNQECEGYFLIDADNNTVACGISWEELKSRFPSASKLKLCSAMDYNISSRSNESK